MVMDMMTQGQPPAAPTDAGPPPDLAAALGAGAGGPPAGPYDATAAAPPEAPPEAPTGAGGDPIDTVSGMLEMGKGYLDSEQDHEDLLEMQKILTQLQNLLTKNQKDADQAMAGNTSPRTLRKAGV